MQFIISTFLLLSALGRKTAGPVLNRTGGHIENFTSTNLLLF